MSPAAELAIEVFQILLGQVHVERRAVRSHVVGIGGLGDGDHAVLPEYPRECDLRGRGVQPGRDPRARFVAEQPSLIDRRVGHDRDRGAYGTRAAESNSMPRRARL